MAQGLFHSKGRTLVQKGDSNNVDYDDYDDNNENVQPVISSEVALSFWGGIDPQSGIVIDTTHPLHGISVAGSILCLPSGRGSCTASQVLLELILNGKAPDVLVLRDRDGLVCVGALIAQSVFPEVNVPEIIQVEDFGHIISNQPQYGRLLSDGSIIFGDNKEEVMDYDDLHKNKLSTGTTKRSLGMSLTLEEQEMMDGVETDAERRAMECIIRYAYILSDSPTYIDVEKAHIDGCTYIGPGGLQFVQRLVEDDGKVSIPTTLNSVSTDLRHWKELGIQATDSQKASRELANAYLALGCSERSFTCAPYLLDDPPTQGQQIVWGESNAVVYANSMLGARTEKYADYLDICCAIVGKVPAVGVHLDENRHPNILLDVTNINFDSDETSFSLLFPVLGHLCGSLSDGEVPILVGLEEYADRITSDHMKAFCAAFGTTGTSPLVHVAGVTAEAKRNPQIVETCNRRHVITMDELDETFHLLDQRKNHDVERVDWIALGNPHLSLAECDHLRDLIEALPDSTKKRNENVNIIACMSRVLYDQSSSVPALRDFGIQFVQDTCWCMLLEPPMIPSNPNAHILTNSGKYAHYGPGLTGRKFRLGTMSDCIDAAVMGKLQRKTTSNFPWTDKKRTYFTSSFHRMSSLQKCSTAQKMTTSNFDRSRSIWYSRSMIGIGKKILKVLK